MLRWRSSLSAPRALALALLQPYDEILGRLERVVA